MRAIIERKNALIREIFSLEDELAGTFMCDNYFDQLRARLKECDEELDSINKQLKEGSKAQWQE